MNQFTKMKENRNSSLEKLKEQINKSEKRRYQDDDDESEFWKMTVDDKGNGFAVIRFLPAPEGEELNFVKRFSYGFKGPTGKWYIENSLVTLGEKDPVSDYNAKMWNTGRDIDKEGVRGRKRRTNYFANIYVVSDPANPENEGKVFKYTFGAQIMKFLTDAAEPPEVESDFIDEDEKPREAFDPFNLWTGADFKLRARIGENKQRNYLKSSFAENGPVGSSKGDVLDDDKLEEIWKQCYSLQDLIAPDKFKSYTELTKQLNRVLGIEAKEPTMESRVMREEPVKSEPEVPWSSNDSEDEDDLEYFRKLAESDWEDT